MDTIIHEYEISVAWKNRSLGILTSPDFEGGLEVATPPPFPDGIANTWSPEHLFTAAVNSCLMTTFIAIAKRSRFNFSHFTSTATGKLSNIDGKYVMSEIVLQPVLTIDNEADREKAERILSKSEAACLISNSIISKVIVTPEIKISVPAIQ